MAQPLNMHNLAPVQAMFIRKSLRLNRRERDRRVAMVQAESSFNKSESKYTSFGSYLFQDLSLFVHFLLTFFSCLLVNDMLRNKVSAAAAFSAAADSGPVKSQFRETEIFEKLREVSRERKFEESIELTLKLNVDPTQGDQNIRGTCILPAGVGNEVRVCVFTNEELVKDAMDAGADLIGDDKFLNDIAAGGKIEIDKIICTTEQIAKLKQYARSLGPKGLMPNIKSGTLVKPDELKDAIK